MIFSNVKSLSIPEGMVRKIELNGTALWEESATYKNWAKYAIDANGSLYNGCGYIADYRLNSSGATVAASGAIHSGYIPFTYGDIIRASGSTAESVTAGGHYFVLCDDTFAVLASTTMSNTTSASFYGASYELQDNGFYKITLDTSKAGVNTLSVIQKAKYFRISFAQCKPGDFVITVNEEIA